MDSTAKRDSGAKAESQSGQTSEINPSKKPNFILLGTKQAGKSASGNTILGREAFESKKSSKSVTRDVAVESGDVSGFPVTVYDTPGLSDRETSEEEIQQMISEKVLHECESGLCVFLLVISTYRFTEEDQRTVEKIEKILGEKYLEKTWILFTRGDELNEENMTIQEFIEGNEQLKTLVEKYEQRYYVFNNKERGSSDQARLLLAGTLQSFIAVGNLTRPQDKPDTPDISLSSMRIVLLGKTGFGKSASGNTILGQREFESDLSTKSVTSVCSVKHATVSGRSVSIVDTPGYFDTKMKAVLLMKEIARSVYLSSPGPHAFLILLKVNDRFTEHEQQIPKQIELMFGRGVLKYSIILFTHGDQLEGKTIEELIEENSGLRHLVQKCGGRFNVFNNKHVNNRDQVNELLQKIDSMIEQNGGGHYSNEVFEDAHRLRQEEEKRKRKERENKKKQPKEKQRQKEIERILKNAEDTVREKMEAKHRSKLERREAERQREDDERKQEQQRQEIPRLRIEKESDNDKSNFEIPTETPEFDQFFENHRSRWYIAAFAIVAAQVTGVVIGGALGLIGGPAGVAIGAAAGAAVGSVVGAAVSSVLLEL